MKFPQRLATYINALDKADNNYRATHYYETVEKIKDKVTLRMFAIRYGKKDDLPLVKEVYRENNEKKWINTDFYFQNMAGWCICWEEKRYSYYGIVKPQDKLVEYKGKKPGVFAIHGWRDCEIRELDESLKYLVVSNKTADNVNIIDFIERFKQYPSLELLAKAGFSYFYRDSRVLKLKGEKQKKFIKFLIANKNDVLENHPSYNDICKMMKLNKSYAEYHEWLKYTRMQEFLSEWKFSYQDCITIEKYLKKQNCGDCEYRDYLVMAQKSGLDLTQSGVLFPKNLLERHNQLSIVYEERENQEKCKKLASIQDKLKELQIHFKGLQVFIPGSLKDFLNIGNALHNCVYSCDYSSRVAKGEIIIIAVCKDNQFIECCELVKEKETLSIAQLRGDHNQDSEYHQDSEKIVNKFIGLYKKSNMSMVLGG